MKTEPWWLSVLERQSTSSSMLKLEGSNSIFEIIIYEMDSSQTSTILRGTDNSVKSQTLIFGTWKVCGNRWMVKSIYKSKLF